ncbi:MULTISPECIES: S-layer homology domain-containing protein [Bacillus]|uniref:S-layer homology domain-containing protein n=1 Tax=Bacillus TaxID=1386 RepID=UPI00114E0DF6|nr:S-layer homology domain-containing protein [Bacillus mycoides]
MKVTVLQTIAALAKKGAKIPAPFFRYLWAVKLPPQNSAGAKELGGSPAACKRPIGEG